MGKKMAAVYFCFVKPHLDNIFTRRSVTIIVLKKNIFKSKPANQNQSNMPVPIWHRYGFEYGKS